MTERKSKRSPALIPVELNPPVSIPLEKLVLSDQNVRQIKSGISIEALAESIARRSLLQSLSVRAVVDESGAETGLYEVQAGGRRLRALQLLVKQKRLAKTALIPCIIKTGGLSTDDSLAENSDREQLHPLDQFRAFASLVSSGQSDQEIAAAYGVSTAVVKQRLRLASASDNVLTAYADDAISLDQLMAFCVSTDHARQGEVLDLITEGRTNSASYSIKRLMTESAVEADDPRARFVGLESYLEAGGTIIRDLFDEEESGWLQDPALLMRLVSEKLESARLEVMKQGWKWAQTFLETPYGIKRDLRQLQPLSDALSETDQTTYDTLAAEYDTFIDALDDDGADEKTKKRLDELEDTLAAFENKPPEFSAEDMARAGVLLMVSHKGMLSIEYGFVKAEDDAVEPESASPNTEEDDDELDDSSSVDHHMGGAAGKPLPERLVQDLTSYRTVALRNAVAKNVELAFLAALYAFVASTFYHRSSESCLQLSVRDSFPSSAPGLRDWQPSADIEKRHALWEQRLPEAFSELWAGLDQLSLDDKNRLFAHCVSLSVNAVREPRQPRAALRHADLLADALTLDMTSAGWVTTVDTYLGRVTKDQILEAVREAKGDRAARLIEHLKKDKMAGEAERLLADTRWLPAVLRGSVANGTVPVDQEVGLDPADTGNSEPLAA